MKAERLKHVADVRVSNVDKKSVDGELPVRLCNYTDVYYHERITSGLDFMAATATPAQRATFRLRAGDVVLTKDSETADDIGVSALVTEDIPELVCGYHLAVVRPRPDVVHGPYLRWVIAGSASRQAMAMAATGVTRFGLRSEAIADLEVPLPPLDEQQATADYLNRETARIDALLTAKQRMAILVLERMHGIIEETIWSGTRRTRPLMDAVDPRRPVMYGIVLPGPDVGDGGIAIVKGGDVAKGRLTWDQLAKTTPEIEAPYARARLREGDILVAIRGGIGDIALVSSGLTGANITQDVARVAPRPDVRSRWLLYALRSPTVQADMRSRVTGATITGLNIWELDRVRIPFSDLQRQSEDLARLETENERRKSLVAALASQVSLLKERRQALITAAVTGGVELGVAV